MATSSCAVGLICILSWDDEVMVRIVETCMAIWTTKVGYQSNKIHRLWEWRFQAKPSIATFFVSPG